MIQKDTSMEPRFHERRQFTSLTVFFSELILGIMMLAGFIFGTYSLLNNTIGRFKPVAQSVAHASEIKHTYLNLSILINQPGMQKDWPGYSNTRLVVPADSIVTVTIHNYDLGDTTLPGGSPFGHVQGTIGNTAIANGNSYTTLALDKIAHTFSIPQLGLNVPIPGDAPKGADFASVTFTFHTGKAGTYTFRCFDPCGTGSSGWMGPMLTKGYMVGTLTVQ
jgi:heme/copper-type cytochrome/quinol oxidase subunit 2